MSETVDTSDGDITSLSKDELCSLVQQLKTQLASQESDFGEKRSLMKGLYLKKENELSLALARIESLEAELTDVRSAANLLESGREDESIRVRQQYEAQVTSLQTILDESMQEATQLATEKENLLVERKRLLLEIQNLKNSNAIIMKHSNLSPQHAASTSSEHRNSHAISSYPNQSPVCTSGSPSAEKLEELMEQAKADADRLRTVVQPYEEEVAALKVKLEETQTQLRALTVQQESDSRRATLFQTLWQRATHEYLEWREENLGLLLQTVALLSNSQVDTLRSQCRDNKRRALACGDRQSRLREFLLKRRSISSTSRSLERRRGLELCADGQSRGKHRSHSADPFEGGDDTLESSSDSGDTTSSSCRGQPPAGESSHEESPCRDVLLESSRNQGNLHQPPLQRLSTAKCPHCSVHEEQMVKLQEKCTDLERQLRVSQEESFQHRSSVSLWRSLHEKMRRDVKAQAEGHAEKLSQLESSLEAVDTRLTQSLDKWAISGVKLKETFEKMRQERLEIKEMYLQLMRVRDKVTSQELRNESIMLPNEPDELQFFALQLREKNIDLLAVREHLEERMRTESTLLREQCAVMSRDLQNLRQQVRQQEMDLRSKDAALESSQQEAERAHNFCKTYHASADAVAKENQDYRKRYQTLLADLHNSESVQRDFVQLAQRLQVQLESLRQEASSEVRWQHEEDVHECNECKCSFASLAPPMHGSLATTATSPGVVCKRKLHCRHCGKIFCSDCLTRTVASGPAHRHARVCGVCHTLLVKDAAPYFSAQRHHVDSNASNQHDSPSHSANKTSTILEHST